jgi:hypothetical protein
MAFCPEEILLSPTGSCNLACVHCGIKRTAARLPVKLVRKFLVECKKDGIDRVGFTGGEPFLAGNFLYAVTKFAAKEGFLFSRIMTNGVWYKSEHELNAFLRKLFNAGYDGSICLSVDAYHPQSARKLARFIKCARSVWNRTDIVSIVYVTGRDLPTKAKLAKLARLLKGRLSGFGSKSAHIRSADTFIRISKIDLSPIGKAFMLKDPWDGRWFKEDYCKGPGNVFSVEPSGEIKPCCGYASALTDLSIANIARGCTAGITENIRQNRIVYAIFNSGLSSIKDKLIKRGVRFPGKTSNHCFFCHYVLTKVPRPVLLKALGG